MKTLFRVYQAVVLFLLCVLASNAAAQNPKPAATRWFRGNTHSHTLNSDGNASPSEVVKWYKDHGYSFVVISDHEYITDVSPLNREYAEAGKFLVLRGQEVTQKVIDSGVPDRRRQAHVGAIGLTTKVIPIGPRGLASSTTMAATYERNIREIIAAGGLPQINHPNFRWSVRPEDLAGLPDSTLFEVWNSHPWVNNLGGSEGSGRISLSTEELWDNLLSRGKTLFAVASDDAHEFLPEQLKDPLATRPGGGWVMVRADTLTELAIIAALKAGNFYSSNGVFLDNYSVDSRKIEIQIALPTRPEDVRRFRTRFVGRGGRVLADVSGRSPSYLIRGNEGFVRATITDSNGLKAWIQPVMIPSH